MLTELWLWPGSALTAVLPVLVGFADTVPPQYILIHLGLLLLLGTIVIVAIVVSVLVIRSVRKRRESEREE